MNTETIRLVVETREYETLFRVVNFDELGSDTLLKLEAFSKSRGGLLKFNQKLFYVKKRWDSSYAKKVFDALEIPVVIEQLDAANLDEALHTQRVYFGKYYGKRWEEIPESYLRYLVASNSKNREFAKTELMRRGGKSADAEAGIDGTIGFGKYKGRKWSELPIEYLRWLRDNFDTDHKDYVRIERAIAFLGDRPIFCVSQIYRFWKNLL